MSSWHSVTTKISDVDKAHLISKSDTGHDRKATTSWEGAQALLCKAEKDTARAHNAAPKQLKQMIENMLPEKLKQPIMASLSRQAKKAELLERNEAISIPTSIF